MLESTRKTRVGRVTANKMAKTVVVSVVGQRRHPRYKKTVRTLHQFKAHDENSTCTVGDMVRIMETRPLSREKRWRVAEILRRGKGEEYIVSGDMETPPQERSV